MRLRHVLAIALASSTAASAVAARQSQSAPPPAGDQVRTVVAEIDGAVGGVAVDRLGYIFVADFRDTVWRVSPDGRIEEFATGLYGASGNALDSKGRLLQSNFSGHYVTRIDRDGDKTIVAEGLNGPVGIAVNPDDSFVVCNCSGNSLASVSIDGQVLPLSTSPLLNCPNGIVRAPDEHYYVVNYSDARLLKVTPTGDVSEFAILPGGGNGHITFVAGALYATSFRGHRIYRITLDGEVTLIAGTGALGETDGNALGQATFSWPNGIAAGPQGDRLYVNDFVNRFPPTLAAPPAPKSSLRQITFESLPVLLARTLQAGGIEAMTETYRAWKADPGHAAVNTELPINGLGYQLMNGGNLEAAIRVFTLNTESYPQSANVWDSLGEAHMNAGETAKAIANYEKSLALNPGNDNAVAMLKKLRGGSAAGAGS